jgi:hypothetical protein
MNTPFELRRPFSLLPEDEALEASESIVASGEPHCKFHRGLTELYDERSFELNLITRENLQCRVDHVQPLSYTTCDELALTHYSDFEMGDKQPESMLALMSRVKIVLAGVFEKYADDETVMIVTHSDWIISALMELYPDTLGFVPQNGEVVPIVVEDMREGKSDQHQNQHQNHGSFVVVDAKHAARDQSDHYKQEHEKNAGKSNRHYAVAKKESTAKTGHKDLDDDDDDDKRKSDEKHSSGEEKRHSSTHSTSDAEHKKAAADDDHKESKHDGHHHSSDKDDAEDDDDSTKSLKKSDGKKAADSDAEVEAKAKTERKEDDSKSDENSDAAHELFETSAKNDKKTSTKKKAASLGSNPLRDSLTRALDNINEHFDRLDGEDDR